MIKFIVDTLLTALGTTLFGGVLGGAAYCFYLLGQASVWFSIPVGIIGVSAVITLISN